jgi:hypothetical protein
VCERARVALTADGDAHSHARALSHAHLFGSYLMLCRFSESGKLVHRLFDKIESELIDDARLLYVVLIDEVESIASQRGGGQADPQDAVRVSHMKGGR